LKRLDVSFRKGGNYGKIFFMFEICYRLGVRLRVGIESRYRIDRCYRSFVRSTWRMVRLSLWEIILRLSYR
jgi:hypothetical protein